MKKIILLLLVSTSLKAQVTTYTLTPFTNGVGANVSTGMTTNNGQFIDFPTNSIFPVFSRDSTKVQWLDIYDRTHTVMSVPDSIKHFYTGSFQFIKVKSLDSFFHCCMTK